jgi:ribosome-associated protein
LKGKPTNRSQAFQWIRTAARAAEEKSGFDIIALDVRDQTSLTDAFLFISANSHIHARALEDAVREELGRAGVELLRTDGQRGHSWRALDYGSFLVHIMEVKTREFYLVERLWDQAKKIDVAVRSRVRAADPAVKTTRKKSLKTASSRPRRA